MSEEFARLAAGMFTDRIVWILCMHNVCLHRLGLDTEQYVVSPHCLSLQYSLIILYRANGYMHELGLVYCRLT